MWSAIRRRCAGTRGEMLLESLLSLLLAATALAMLASAIGTSSRLIAAGEKMMGDYTASVTALNSDGEMTSSGTVTFKYATSGGDISDRIDVIYVSKKIVGQDQEVIAYEKKP